MNLISPAGVETQPAHELVAGRKPIGRFLLWVLVAGAAFHLAYWSVLPPVLILVYLFALVQLAFTQSWRRAFYGGLLVGLLVAIGRLDFFWRIFGAAAIALWFVYAFWVGAFVALTRQLLRHLPASLALCTIPIAWCGLEYFRSELYYLRFSWLTPGLAFASSPGYAMLGLLGVYGTGLLLMIIACAAALAGRTSSSLAALLLVAGTGGIAAWGRIPLPSTESANAEYLSIAGVQLEFPGEKEVLVWLNELTRRHPDADLLVLSEYTLEGPVPNAIKLWCREHHRYLVIGGKEPVSETRFYNTVFVVSPSGDIVFRQAKSVPIQFFNDGLPATEQTVWQSPWGKLGICICYDLSYTRVTDSLIELGAQALIVPTMDVTDWGRRQHQLHARIGPTRAAEYRLPIFRLASSGISQAIDCAGRVLCSAPFPGDGKIIAANLVLSQSGRRPLDRWLAPMASLLTGIGLIGLTAAKMVGRFKRRFPAC
jgi:apolipoprotein N-acyltransferase